MPQTQLIRYQDVTGGLNLRADPFQIGDTESPDLLNVEVDPVRGFHSRRPWVDWADATTGDGMGEGEGEDEFDPWNPRSAFSHVMGNGQEVLFVASSGFVLVREPGDSGFEVSTIACDGDPHGADFAAWGDAVYVACGRSLNSQVWTEGGITSLTDPSSGSNWSNDPLDPKSNTMPKAEFTCVHNGCLFVANTEEASSSHPQRVRWSLPNDPDAWAQLDYIDFVGADGPITGIAPLNDHLLIFFPKEVWALYGYDMSSFVRQSLTKTVGAANRQCITHAEGQVFFSSLDGVFSVNPDSIDEVSTRLRPALDAVEFTRDADSQWLSWAGQRLYWSAPYGREGAPTTPRSLFVLDPSIGAWVLHELGDGAGVTNVFDSPAADGPVAVSFASPTLLRQGSIDAATDVVGGDEYEFESYFRTRWIDAKLPTIKKRFKRPDFVVAESDSPYALDVFVYHDYDDDNARRTKVIHVGSEGTSGLWFEDPDWNGTSDSLDTPPLGAPIWSATPDPEEAGWSAGTSGSAVERMSSIGTAVATQLEIRGPLGRAWGVNAIVLKYVLRRVR